MKPLFCRIGSKRKQVKMLEKVFPTHQVYVEPFFGGGAVFFGKTPSDKEVVNDLDSKLVADYRRVLDAPTDSSAYPSAKTLAAQRRLLSSHPKSTAGQITESIIRRCNGFGGKYVMDASDIAKSSNPAQKTNHIQDYKKRLEHATILNQDYRKVIKAHDSAKTFFFLDPPYEMSKGVDYAAGSESFDFDELARVLQNLKGDFLITINDSPLIRKAFAGFKLYPYVVKGHHSETSPIGAKDRKELLISNYMLPHKWRSGGLTGGMEAKVSTALRQVKVRPNGCVHATYEMLRQYAPLAPPWPFPPDRLASMGDVSDLLKDKYETETFDAHTTSKVNVAKADYEDLDYERVNNTLNKIAREGLPAMVRIPAVMKNGVELHSSHVVAFVRKAPGSSNYVIADIGTRTSENVCDIKLQDWTGDEAGVRSFEYALPDLFLVIKGPKAAAPAPAPAPSAQQMAGGPALTPAQAAAVAAAREKAKTISFGSGRLGTYAAEF